MNRGTIEVTCPHCGAKQIIFNPGIFPMFLNTCTVCEKEFEVVDAMKGTK